MDIRAKLDAVVAQYDLLQHPFYQAWSAGTLPVDALKAYANDWASFIGQVPKGWAAHGDQEIAAEEVEHRELWEGFARALGVTTGHAACPEVEALVAEMSALCDDPVTSLGALYAFEQQQPGTSKSKLQGLHNHYPLPSEGHVYFQVHENDIHEPALLAERIAALAPADQARALAACERVSKALWNGLSGLYDRHGAGSAC